MKTPNPTRDDSGELGAAFMRQEIEDVASRAMGQYVALVDLITTVAEKHGAEGNEDYWLRDHVEDLLQTGDESELSNFLIETISRHTFLKSCTDEQLESIGVDREAAMWPKNETEAEE